jgi:hypothetical protein
VNVSCGMIGTTEFMHEFITSVLIVGPGVCRNPGPKNLVSRSDALRDDELVQKRA